MFGPHPTGGGVHFQSKGTNSSGNELGTDALLVNALLWAAGGLEQPASVPQPIPMSGGRDTAEFGLSPPFLGISLRAWFTRQQSFIPARRCILRCRSGLMR